VIGCGALLLGGGLFLTSRVEALWQLYLSLGLLAALGMSAIYVPCNATVVRWFTWRRGLALGIASSGHGFGNLLIPPLAAVLMAGYGWRTAYALLALLGGALILRCALAMVRDPERWGCMTVLRWPRRRVTLRTTRAFGRDGLTGYAQRTTAFGHGVVHDDVPQIFLPMARSRSRSISASRRSALRLR
jgi:MFS family permease